MMMLTYPDIISSALATERFPLRVFGFQVHSSFSECFPKQSTGAAALHGVRRESHEVMLAARNAASLRTWPTKPSGSALFPMSAQGGRVDMNGSAAGATSAAAVVSGIVSTAVAVSIEAEEGDRKRAKI